MRLTMGALMGAVAAVTVASYRAVRRAEQVDEWTTDRDDEDECCPGCDHPLLFDDVGNSLCAGCGASWPSRSRA